MHREGAWTGAVEPPKTKDWRRAGCEGAALTLGSGLVACLAAPGGFALPVGTLIFAFGGLGLLFRHGDERHHAEHDKALALREEFGTGPVWTVDLMIRQGEAPTGRDQGLMWVEGGRVMYSGLRTSFALVPTQAMGSVWHDAALPDLRLRLNLVLTRETPVGALSLSFWPLSEDARRAENDAAGLRYALNTVFDGRWTHKDLAGQWPPVTLGPGAPSPKSLRRGTLLRVAAGTTLGAWIGFCLAFANLGLGLAAFLVLGGAGGLFAWGATKPRWRAYRDARRLWGSS